MEVLPIVSTVGRHVRRLRADSQRVCSASLFHAAMHTDVETLHIMQDAYGGRIVFTPPMSLSDSASGGGQTAQPASAAAASQTADASAAQPTATASVQPTDSAADGATANGGAAEPGSTQAASNGVHSPEKEARAPDTAPAAAESAQQAPAEQRQPETETKPLSGAMPPGLQAPAPRTAQQPAQEQQQQQQQGGPKQRSAVFDGHDLLPSAPMLHVGDEVEFTLVHDRIGAEPRATRVRPPIRASSSLTRAVIVPA